jgi:hypothetical protein
MGKISCEWHKDWKGLEYIIGVCTSPAGTAITQKQKHFTVNVAQSYIKS